MITRPGRPKSKVCQWQGRNVEHLKMFLGVMQMSRVLFLRGLLNGSSVTTGTGYGFDGVRFPAEVTLFFLHRCIPTGDGISKRPV